MEKRISSRILAVLLCTALCSAYLVGAQKNDAADVQLQAAIHKGTVEGDLDQAIRMFKDIVSKYSANHAVAASALLHMGQAYEKLGNAEARKAYERISREFGDQKEVAADAGRRLAILRAAPNSDSSAPRPVLNSSKNSDGSISFDGRWMAVTRWSGGDNEIAIQDMSTGQLKGLLSASCGKPCVFSELPLLSPDSSQLAYTWYDDNEIEGRGQLRVLANQTGAKPRVLVRNRELSVWPRAWSPDGKSLLVNMRKDDRTWQLGWVSVADGSLKTLKSLEWRIQPGNSTLSLSPDGNYIAYSALATNPTKPVLATTDQADTHIYILAADGSRELELVKTAGANRSPVWTPDGAHIVFTSNLSGTTDLWSVAVRDGRAPSSPFLVRKDVGNTSPIGITQSGSYYYVQTRPGVEQVSIAELVANRETRILESFVGMGPSWSPDGKSLAFTRHSAHGNDTDLVVRSLETRDEKVYAHDGLRGGPPRWFRDGRGFLQNTAMLDQSFFAANFIDVRSGVFKELFTAESYMTGVTAVSPDDKTLYFLSRDLNNTVSTFDRIAAVDLDTKKQRTVVALPGTAGSGFAVSPDGRMLAIASTDAKTRDVRLSLVRVDGSAYHEIYGPFRAANPYDKLAWTKDGRSLLFATSSDSDWRIMRIGIEGGTPEFTGLAIKDLFFFDLSPDGSLIAFSTGAMGTSTAELYAIDNLPALLKDSK